MKKNGISLFMVLLAALCGGGLTFLVKSGSTTMPVAAPAPVHTAAAAPCTYGITRSSGFRLTHPLIASEPLCESPRFEGLRSEIRELVTELEQTGKVRSASVYVRDFDKSEWTWFNGEEPYDPGSMMKVPLLITYLAMAEEDPSLLKRTYTCEQVDVTVPQHTAFPSEQALGNVSYTVEQLLELCVVHSDNRATVMLLRHMAKDRYMKTFTDLGLSEPKWSDKSYRMTVREYSVFMKALYNSSLLGPVRSEYALDLLSRSDFTYGLVAGLPPGVEVAHKFGEAGDGSEVQLHESGLVYAANAPYLITVMTRGTDPHDLAESIARISALVYSTMRGD